MSSPLDRLVGLSTYKDYDDVRSCKIAWRDREYLDNWVDNFKHSRTSSCFKDDVGLDILTDKGVYPYDYMNTWDKPNETELPSKQHSDNKLYDGNISDDDYDRAKLVWDRFNLKYLGEYRGLYLRCDVLQLTDVFENFRNICLKYYGLDPACYMTLPKSAWDAMLKMIRIELDLVYDQDMYEMLEKGKRGGVCQVSSKYAVANNTYMNNYHANKISSYLIYLDADDLYGLATSMKLPYANFEWSDDIKSVDDITSYKDDDVGYILEVYLHYPKELHDLHNEYPLAPEHRCLNSNMVPDVSKYIYKVYQGKHVIDEKPPKLLLTLYGKENYAVHISEFEIFFRKRINPNKHP